MIKKGPITDHFKRIDIIRQSYKDGNYNICEKYCTDDIRAFPLYKDDLADGLPVDPDGYYPLRLVSFETLAKVYEKQQRYDDAIKICELAISHSLSDGTAGGFSSRIKRIENKKK